MESPVYDADEFVKLSASHPVVDVRTPAEFRAGHIPGAVNMPLFSNDERELIGITYAEEGRLKATRIGLDLVGPRMNRMLDDLKGLVAGDSVLVHCWRGGMRSESVAWLLNFSGEYEAATLTGGYKAFRRFTLRQFAVPRDLVIMGGLTGSGKTEVLAGLRDLGEQVVDLEDLAKHKGSAFGAIGLPDQPTQQQFENDLAIALSRTDPTRRLWLEDESRRIGRCMLPGELWTAMRNAPCLVLEKPTEVRRAHLIADYGRADPNALIDAIWRIQRRLGSESARFAAESVGSGDLETACRVLLEYYDKTYAHGLSQRNPSTVHRFGVEVESTGDLPREVAAFADTIAAGDDSGPVKPSEWVQSTG
ncbi:MAG TPA: tRNA 2-selenouridine(34) synthase MnmH [Rhodothermales bacterium]|nr:tRNA 2-selenouridine(34) synthase MnmH [Rhodothermales bacterium]